MSGGTRAAAMIRERELGGCYAYSKADGNCYGFAIAEYPTLLAQWMAGAAFYTGTTIYGICLTVRLGDVVAISHASPESLRAARDDARANRADDAADDMLVGAA